MEPNILLGNSCVDATALEAYHLTDLSRFLFSVLFRLKKFPRNRIRTLTQNPGTGFRACHKTAVCVTLRGGWKSGGCGARGGARLRCAGPRGFRQRRRGAAPGTFSAIGKQFDFRNQTMQGVWARPSLQPRAQRLFLLFLTLPPKHSAPVRIILFPCTCIECWYLILRIFCQRCCDAAPLLKHHHVWCCCC